MDQMVEEPKVSEEELQMRKEVFEEVFEGKDAPIDAADSKPEDAEIPETDREETSEEEVPESEKDTPPEDKEPPSPEEPSALNIALEKINSRLDVLDSMENRLKQTERRIGSLQNEFHNAKQAAAEVQKAPTQQEMADAAKSEEAWDELKNDFPEWATAIDGRIAAAKSTEVPDLSGVEQSIESVKGSMVTKDDIQVMMVETLYPDFRKTIASPEYKTWLAQQSAELQAQANNGRTAREAVDVLQRFEKSQTDSRKSSKDITESRKKRLKDAASVPSSTKRNKPPKAEVDLSEAELRSKIANEVWDGD